MGLVCLVYQSSTDLDGIEVLEDGLKPTSDECFIETVLHLAKLAIQSADTVGQTAISGRIA